MEVTVILIEMVALVTVTKRISTSTGGLRNNKSRDYPNYSMVKIGQNIEKNPGDLRILAVTQTPANSEVKNSQGYYQISKF